MKSILTLLAALLLTGALHGAPSGPEENLRLLPQGPPPAEELTVVDVCAAPLARGKLVKERRGRDRSGCSG
jgi:hypothetical protein